GLGSGTGPRKKNSPLADLNGTMANRSKWDDRGLGS
ncbi:hypothetical protein AVEN_266173-1, partial [Araneus ventricosus]